MNKRAPCSPLSATTETGGSLTRQRARLQGQSDQDLIVLDQNSELLSKRKTNRGGNRGENSGAQPNIETESASESNEINGNDDTSHQETNIGGQLEETEVNIPQLNHQTSSNLNTSEGRSQYSVSEMFELAKQNMYPKKIIYFGKDYSKKKEYTSVLNFFDHPSKFNEKPSNEKKFEFICKIAKCKMTASFGAVTNLNTHLKQHESTKAWYYSYKKNKKSRGNFLISEKQLNFKK